MGLLTDLEEIRYLEEYQIELRKVGNDLSKQAKAKLRELKKRCELIK